MLEDTYLAHNSPLFLCNGEELKDYLKAEC